MAVQGQWNNTTLLPEPVEEQPGPPSVAIGPAGAPLDDRGWGAPLQATDLGLGPSKGHHSTSHLSSYRAVYTQELQQGL